MGECRYDLNELLAHIDPARLSYQEWLNVGMALKEEGWPGGLELWEEWSSRDMARYHPGECSRKWEGFRGSAKPVTAGTIVQYAKEQGWQPEYLNKPDYELDWHGEIGSREDIGKREDKHNTGILAEPADEEWQPARDLVRYLETIFYDNEQVGYVTRIRVYERDGNKRFQPSRGVWDRTAGQLLQKLKACVNDEDIRKLLGDYPGEAGAFIRFNPLDGGGVLDSNVAAFRFALVESDAQSLEQQYELIRRLELPVACLVHSGGKSLHAIVRVEANSIEQYRERVQYLYKVCEKGGLLVDKQNGNPARLSRMPGVRRGEHKQFLVATNIGKAGWQEWREWTESIQDDLPEPESLAAVWDRLPDLAPPLIEGVLRQGHKMLLAGPSKAGKSFALIELCCAVAEGRDWLGWPCAKGRVLYVNLELDRASCLHRFKDVYGWLRWPVDNLQNIDIWNLRGNAVPMDKLAPRLIHRAAQKNYLAIIIDPIYKVITGDENSADQMARFCNQFDKVCTELNCAVIYCHHHSKGFQGSKRSMDRASGSGVFARDPDALLDLIELEIPKTLQQQEENNVICDLCRRWLLQKGAASPEEIDESYGSEGSMLGLAERRLGSTGYVELLKHVCAARSAVRQRTAWRIEGTLREFPKFAPVNIWFDYPVHKLDKVGYLQDIQPESQKPAWQKKGVQSKKVKAEQQADRIWEAGQFCSKNGGSVYIKDLMGETGLSRNSIKNYIDRSSRLIRDTKTSEVKQKD